MRPYRHPPSQKDDIEQMVKELLEVRVIRTVRYTVKDKFPIPMIEELIDELHGSVVFLKLDLRKCPTLSAVKCFFSKTFSKSPNSSPWMHRRASNSKLFKPLSEPERTLNHTFMGLQTKLETTTKNHQASIQNLEEKFDRLADKQSGRPSGSLPSNTQPNPNGSSSKPYQPLQARNEHVNAVFTRSGKSYDLPTNLNDQQNDFETPINFDSEDENEESTPQLKSQIPKPNDSTPTILKKIIQCVETASPTTSDGVKVIKRRRHGILDGVRM
ncbi:hypothetical protein Tco_0883046 [Tanacetum coccineum]